MIVFVGMDIGEPKAKVMTSVEGKVFVICNRAQRRKCYHLKMRGFSELEIAERLGGKGYTSVKMGPRDWHVHSGSAYGPTA